MLSEERIEEIAAECDRLADEKETEREWITDFASAIEAAPHQDKRPAAVAAVIDMLNEQDFKTNALIKQLRMYDSAFPREVADTLEHLVAERDEFQRGEGIATKLVGELEIENIEQARLLGMSGEREADLLGEVERLQHALEKARDALNEVTGLIEESSGVYGLPPNDDLSPWDELVQGGRFERLGSLNEAIATIDEVLKK